jgi:hypothetical protein
MHRRLIESRQSPGFPNVLSRDGIPTPFQDGDALVVFDINSATTRHQSGDFCSDSRIQFSEDPIIENLIFARSARWYEKQFDVAFFGCRDDNICPMGGIDIQNEKARTSVGDLGLKPLEIPSCRFIS